jgi:membrane protease YdiL (CAAX protease family)
MDNLSERKDAAVQATPVLAQYDGFWRRLNALLEVSLVSILIIIASFFFAYIPKQVFFWPLNAIISHLVMVAIAIIILLVAGRSLKLFIVSFENVNLDLKIVAIWAIPLCFLNIITSATFSLQGLAISILLLAIVEALIILFTLKSPITRNWNKKTSTGSLTTFSVIAIGSLIIIPSMFLPMMSSNIAIAPNSIYLFPLSFIFVGPCEELVFRGYTQSRLNDAFGRPYRFLGINLGWA